jgi:hypothetical protein
VSLEVTFRPEISAVAVGWERRKSPVKASSQDLLISFFPGDIEIRSQDATFTSNGSWVPLLNFIAGVLQVRDLLSVGGSPEYLYVFTEVSHEINFRRDEDDVIIESTLAPGTIVVGFDELAATVCDFARREIERVDVEFPGMLGHPLVQDLRQACDRPPSGMSVHSISRDGEPPFP